MKIVNTVAALRTQLAGWRKGGAQVALVPTMGALHAGHLSLVDQAKRVAGRVIVSIFVNPSQFGPGEDFTSYPRQLAADIALLEGAGADLLFTPTASEVYPPGFSTTVRVDGLDQPMEGRARPGHFDGVATVVAKLLLMAGPDVAIFGEKDWQQLAIIRRLAGDLNLPVQILGAPIARDADGLALSSRNAYLSAIERQCAATLPEALREASAAISAGGDVANSLATALDRLQKAGFQTDYLTLADANTLASPRSGHPQRLFVAARIGATRLIDNWPAGEAR